MQRPDAPPLLAPTCMLPNMCGRYFAMSASAAGAAGPKDGAGGGKKVEGSGCAGVVAVFAWVTCIAGVN